MLPAKNEILCLHVFCSVMAIFNLKIVKLIIVVKFSIKLLRSVICSFFKKIPNNFSALKFRNFRFDTLDFFILLYLVLVQGEITKAISF